MNNRKILTAIGWSFTEKVSSQIVSLIVSIILARILLPEDYGILAIVNVFVSIGDALVIGGFGVALVQKKDSDRRDFNSICLVSVILSLLLYLILFFCSPLISSFYGNDDLTLMTRVLGVRLVFSAINSIQLAYVQKKILFKKNCVVSTISAFISGIVGVTLAYAGAGAWVLIVQNLTMVVCTTILLVFVLEWKPRLEFSLGSIRQMWGYGSRVLLATMVDTLKDNIRTLVVGKVFTSADIAYYNQGKRFPQILVNDIVNSVGKVLLPAFSEQQNDKKKNTDLMRMSIRVSSFILLPLIFGLIGVADNFVLAFLTDKWMPCVLYMKILSLVYITRSIDAILKNALLAIGRSGANLFHEIVTSALTIVLIFLAAFCYKSIPLIAWSYVLIAIVGTIIFSCFSFKYYPYNIGDLLRDYLPSLTLSILMCVVVYFVGKIPMNLLLVLAIQVIVGMIVYLGIAYLFRMEEYEIVLMCIKKFSNKKGS